MCVLCFGVVVYLLCVLCVCVLCCVLGCVSGVLCVVCVPRLGTRKKPPVCRFKTTPCVQAKRAHVETHVRVMPVHTEAF